MSSPQTKAEKPQLKLDWCSHEAAKYAVEHWHYSKSLPGADMVKIGIWEDGNFIGCVIFSRGATPHIAGPFGLKQQQICELTRVALTNHKTPVSRIIAISIKMLRIRCPATRGIVSYADVDHDHHGGIYQAGGWTYLGCTNIGARGAFIIKGKKVHPKTIHSIKGGVQSLAWVRAHLDPKATEFMTAGKHKYFMPLDDDMRAQIAPLAKPYPKRSLCVASIDSDAPGSQSVQGSATLTAALQAVNL